MPKKITHEEFVKKLKAIKPHIQVISQYNGNKSNIIVKCTIHNYIWNSKPNWLMHEDKYDCQKCYDERRGKTTVVGKEKFVKKANTIHHNRFDYSKSQYINNKTKLIIICSEHGEFSMTPEKHINRGQGCPKCANKDVTTEEFIKKAQKIHGTKYDYSKSNYINTISKVCIICPKHGEFWQTVESHLYGKCGCPTCNSSKLEILIDNILKNNNFNYLFQYKPIFIGNKTLDFYLPDYNIGIECQGEQHINPIKYFGGNKRFNIDLKRDITKNKLCNENGIRLIYIANIPSLLPEMLQNPIFLNIYNKNNTICVTSKEIEPLLLKKLIKKDIVV